MSYAKLHGSILDSSVWQTSKETRLVWITMLAMKDQDGIVEAAIPGLARRAGVSLAEAEDALATLMMPDPYSRTPDHDGRRIAAIDGGWVVLNHDVYRDRENEAERRAKGADRQARRRSRLAVAADQSAAVRSSKIGTYLIVQESTGYMKVGKTINADERLQMLQTASPTPLRLVLWVPGDHEAIIHAALVDHRASGEWFNHTAETEALTVRMMRSVTMVTERDCHAGVTLGNARVTLAMASDTDTDSGQGAGSVGPDGPGRGGGQSQPPDRGAPLPGTEFIHSPHPLVDRAGIRDRGASVPQRDVAASAPESARRPVPIDPLAEERTRLLRELVPIHRAAFERVRVDLELRVPGMAVIGDPAERALRALMVDQASLEGFEARARHVIAVREHEARRLGSVRFLGASIWEPRSFGIAVSMAVGEDRSGPSKRSAFDVIDEEIAKFNAADMANGSKS